MFDRTSTHRRQLHATLSAMKKAPFMKENYIQVRVNKISENVGMKV
jgi:hypothetical protein